MFSLQRVKLCLCYLFQLKMWISFMIPKIEDGNNFGVSIQEDTLGEIQSVESEAAAFFDQISRYFVSRGKIVSKVDIKIHKYVVKNRENFEAFFLPFFIPTHIRHLNTCICHTVIISDPSSCSCTCLCEGSFPSKTLANLTHCHKPLPSSYVTRLVKQ